MVTDWGMFCREVLPVYFEGSSEKLGGPNKTVEIDESKFGRCKYHRGHPVKDQRVFGGVEHEYGRTFLVPVPDRNADTLTGVIRSWIEPGTMLIDCLAAYQDIGSHGYTQLIVNHSISFINPDTGDHTILSSARGATLRPSLDRTAGRTTNSMWPTTCLRRGARHRVSQFTQFLAIAASTDWSCTRPRSDAT